MNYFAPTLSAPTESADTLREALLTDRSRTLTLLYQRTYPMVRRHVLRHGGAEQDAKDVFHDALIILYEKAVGGTLVLTASASTFLVGISRNLWQREVARRSRTTLADLTDEHAQLPDEPEAATPEAELAVLDYVEQLGEKCKSILLSFYYFRQSLEQIAATYQYRTVRSATVQKFKCLERLRQSVRAAWAEAVHH
jgi:RNA polymerase sigma factor (sigma-70 family)